MQARQLNGISYLTGAWPLDRARATLIFIHGAGGSAAFWTAQVEGLGRRVNTLAVDLPGHGRSNDAGKDSIEDYARWVAAFIKDIQAPMPVACGLSMGGAVTQQLLLDYGEPLQAGILISTGAKLKVARAIFDTISNDYNAFIDMLGTYAASSKADPNALQLLKNELARCTPEVVHGDFLACDRFDVSSRLAAIEVPVLVVTAEDDQLTPPKYGRFLEESIRQASRVHVTGAGHIVPLEKPDEINKAILKFLDQNGCNFISSIQVRIQ